MDFLWATQQGSEEFLVWVEVSLADGIGAERVELRVEQLNRFS